MENQLVVAVVFFAALAVFLFIKRRQVAVEWLIFPIMYFAMYRSAWGIKAMDRLGSRLRPVVKVIGALMVGVGFIGMGLITYQLMKNLADIVFGKASSSTVGIVQPFAQGVPGTIFVPFLYFIISVFIIAVLHEFAHGVLARAHHCKVKHSGFAFLGFLVPIIPAAFVEPDEHEMSKRSTQAQLSILAAGAVTNIIFALLLVLVLLHVVDPFAKTLITPLGVEVVKVEPSSPAADAMMVPGELVKSINGVPILDSKGLLDFLEKRNPGDAIMVLTNVTTRPVLLSEHPTKKGKAFLGFQVMNRFDVSTQAKNRFGEFTINAFLWFSGLLFWLFNLSLGIGLFNLVPLGPIDGGKMMQLALRSWFEDEVAHRLWMAISIIFLSTILLNVGAAFFV